MSQSNPTDKEAALYAEHFVRYGDKTKAFRNAFPDSKAKPAHQHTKASLFHNLSKVQQRIKEQEAISRQHTNEHYALSVQDIKDKLVQVMEAGLKEKVDAMGNVSAHQLSAVVSAIAELNKMDGNHAPTKKEVSGPDGGAIELDTTWKFKVEKSGD